jgi:hypothetical protein
MSTKTKAPVYKWQVRVYEKDKPHFRQDERGCHHDTRVWRRDYATESSLRRALPWVKRTYPDHQVEVTRYRLEGGFFWMGDRTRVVGVDYP